jgi:hypothetical protein
VKEKYKVMGDRHCVLDEHLQATLATLPWPLIFVYRKAAERILLISLGAPSRE